MQNFTSIALLLCLAASGCNLFEKAAVASDAGMTGDADPMLDGSEPSDTRPSPVDGCQPPSDAELCERFAVSCGELLVPADSATTERYAALDVGTDSASCGDTEFLDVCSSSDSPTVTFDAPSDGRYLVRAHLWASQADSGLIRSRMRLSRDGNSVRTFQVTGTFDQLGTYSALVELTPGEHTFEWQLANDYYDSSVPEDRNLYYDWFEVVGPMVAPTDECGLSRGGVECGSCSGNEVCGFDAVGQCACACPELNGSCAAEGPAPDDSCAVCSFADGWGVGGAACDDGDACTDDVCDEDLAICRNRAIACSGGLCETGTCNNGSCEYATLPDDDSCGNGGVCTGGVCGCPDGTTEERMCANQVDEDCDGDIDCADADCDGRNCGAGMTCTAGTCQ